MIRIWIDDERQIPHEPGRIPLDENNWWCCSTNEAIALIAVLAYRREGEEILLDIDHDAGEFAEDGGDFINVLKAYSHNWGAGWVASKKLKVHFHSANPVGVKNMRAVVESCPWMEEVKDA